MLCRDRYNVRVKHYGEQLNIFYGGKESHGMPDLLYAGQLEEDRTEN